MSATSRHHSVLDQWTNVLDRRLPLTRPQVVVLALWSIGIVLARSGALTSVAAALAPWLGWNVLSLLKRLREWYLEAAAKKGWGVHGGGVHRRDWDVASCAPALLRWMLEQWPATVIPLALDATNIQDRFTVLAISVVYRRCATPVIWTVVPGNTPGAWQPHWERMIAQLAGWIPAGYRILALTDRGLYSPRLYRALVGVGWHPLMRIKAQGYYRPRGRTDWVPLAQLQPPMDQELAWTGEAFKDRAGRIEGTLLIWWTAGHAEPWLILTDLAVDEVTARWYALRSWIEQSFKRLKSAGWNCARTRMCDPARVERHWLALAVAMLWTLKVGGEDEACADAAAAAAAAAEAALLGSLADSPRGCSAAPPAAGAASPSRRGRRRQTPLRWLSIFRRGWNLLNQALGAGRLLLGQWYPEPLVQRSMAEVGFT
jgi:hypothetical protein